MSGAVSRSERQAALRLVPGDEDGGLVRGARAAEELICLQVRTSASDTALARLVLLFGGRGARVRQLNWTMPHAGGGLLSAWVEVAPGRSAHLVRAISRLVDVVDVELGESTARETFER